MTQDNTQINNVHAPVQEPQRQYFFMDRCREYVEAKKKQIGRDLTFCVRTFGCQMNARDSEKLTGILERIGYQPVETEDADFVIYNTCTVRENANKKVYGKLGYLNGLKRKNPEMRIVLCGCMMQEPDVVTKIRKSYSFVDIIFGTHNIYKFAELIAARNETKQMIIDIWKDTDKIVEDLPSERKYFFKSGVNIMFGCNNFCSFCIVPYVRGRERSRQKEDILKEIRSLAADGVIEIMLLGQNVNSYGKNLTPRITFAQLLREIEEIEGIRRIRFMTSHPKDLSDELIEVMKDSKKICTHLHLPLQSGSSRMLKKMRRGYTKEKYLETVDKIRRAVPDISLSTDIIVGFPEEEEEDFLETMEVVKQVRYDSVFTFIYSRRTGTPAAAMQEIPSDIIKNRFDRLLTLVHDISRERMMRHEGMVMDVLVEEENAQREGYMTGRLSSNGVVHFMGDKSMIGKLLPVKLTECKGFYYMGNLL